ncbi:deoxyuridine 5'-triphosphate nucleotidohydrolase protein [Rhizobium phage RHph_N1_15]|nr:deoxyuridine 5'-triphosphate nucleotidohydrolase protein [Rhizobium phage RHph_N1_10]QIG69319.1 deoxyuridine 5'-triphosphate nucleotidohydrolase protein [Rhizobium phage RHph_N1_15]QIG75179.1 deoxyuridine 5'-triphosphate nucleotidohydrolase protein [Rhizobium phage RHph_N2_6]
MRINYKKLHPDAVVPTYGTPHAAGADLVANLKATFDTQIIEEYVLDPGESKLFKTGIAVEMLNGMWAEVRGRSGLAYKHGIAILGGVIDSDYRGDVGVILHNTSDQPFVVKHGERIAQLIFSAYIPVNFIEKKELSGTGRGEKGFGSTGMAA